MGTPHISRNNHNGGFLACPYTPVCTSATINKIAYNFSCFSVFMVLKFYLLSVSAVIENEAHAP